MATSPVFVATPRQGVGTVNTPDTSFTAPSSIATVFTAGSSGSRVERLRAVFEATTSGAGLLNVFVYNGTTYHLIRSIAYAAVTASTTVAPAGADGSLTVYFEGGLILPTGYSLRVSFTVGTGSPVLACTADGGDF